jgi:hypothetical protein
MDFAWAAQLGMTPSEGIPWLGDLLALAGGLVIACLVGAAYRQ